MVMDIALLWDSKLLMERYIAEHVPSSARIEPLVLASPFAPRAKVLIIPTGFAEPKYTKIGGQLSRLKGVFTSFVERGGVLVVFGALKSTRLEFLPEPIEYVSKYGARNLRFEEGMCQIVDEVHAECDGYLMAEKESGWRVLCRDEFEKIVAASLEHGKGVVIATSIHELPSPAFLRHIVERSQIG